MHLKGCDTPTQYGDMGHNGNSQIPLFHFYCSHWLFTHTCMWAICLPPCCTPSMHVFTSATVLFEIVSTVVTENLPRLQRRDWRLVIKGIISALVQDQRNFNTEYRSCKICFWECCRLYSVLASCEKVKVVFWMRFVLSDCGFDLTLLMLAETFQTTDLVYDCL